jgi:hypothetical protein
MTDMTKCGRLRMTKYCRSFNLTVQDDRRLIQFDRNGTQRKDSREKRAVCQRRQVIEVSFTRRVDKFKTTPFFC